MIIQFWVVCFRSQVESRRMHIEVCLVEIQEHAMSLFQQLANVQYGNIVLWCGVIYIKTEPVKLGRMNYTVITRSLHRKIGIITFSARWLENFEYVRNLNARMYWPRMLGVNWFTVEWIEVKSRWIWGTIF